MSHVDDGRLHAYLDGTLGGGGARSGARSGARTGAQGAEWAELEAHLTACAGCRARLETARAHRESAREVLGLLAPDDVRTPPFEEVLARRAGRPAAGSGGATATTTSRPARRAPRRFVPAAWAASIAVALAGGWLARGMLPQASGEGGAGGGGVRSAAPAAAPLVPEAAADVPQVAAAQEALTDAPPGAGAAGASGDPERPAMAAVPAMAAAADAEPPVVAGAPGDADLRVAAGAAPPSGPPAAEARRRDVAGLAGGAAPPAAANVPLPAAAPPPPPAAAEQAAAVAFREGMARAYGLLAQPSSVVDCGTPGGSVVTGVVVDESTGLPIPGSRAHLIAPTCNIVTDSTGRFMMTEVRPGALRVDAGHPGYREFGRLETAVAPGDTLEIVLRLAPGGPLQDCRANADCSVLVSPPALGALPEDDAFRVTAYGTVIALDWDMVGAHRWHACIQGETEVVLSALASRYGPVVDDARCELPLAALGGSAVLRHAETRAPAFRARIDAVSEAGADRRIASLTRYVGPRSAASWRCEFVRAPAGWEPVLCVLVGNAE